MRLLLTILLLASCACFAPPSAAAEKDGASAAALSNILSQASEGGYTLRLAADREEFSLETPFVLTIQVEGPEGGKLSSLDLTPERLEAFDVKKQAGEKPDGNDQDAAFLFEQRLQLDPWISEKYEIPAVTAVIVDADGQSHRLTTDAVELSVIQPDENYWKELELASGNRLKPSLTPGADRRNRLLACLAAAALAAAAVFLLRAWRRRRQAEAARIPEIPPYEQASAALDELLRQELLRQGEAKRYYTGLSDILRRYIERRFALSAPRQTTQEFIAAVASGDSGALKQYAALLREFLLACDMVKFAKATPLAEEGDAAAKTCRQFLEATRPAPEEEPRTDSPRN